MQEWLNEQYRNTQTNKDGKVEGRGLGAFLWQQFVDEDALNRGAQKTANQRTATRLGENLDDLNLGSDATTLDVEGAVISKGRERTKAQSDLAHTRSLQPMQMQMQQSAQQFNQTMQRQLSQDAKSHQLQLMQFAENKDARAAELEYQKLRDRKADMQYNERMEMLDRKDRKQAMSSLAAGIAALGAAFAI